PLHYNTNEFVGGFLLGFPRYIFLNNHQIDRTNMTGLREALQSVLELQKYWTAHTTPEMQERAILVRNRIPLFLEPVADAWQFKVQGGPGSGSNNRVPWVRVFNPELSPSPQEGWYAVLLFAADGATVFLSLNQGTTDWSGGRSKPKDQEAVA